MNTGYVRICKILGNGDFRRGREHLAAIAQRLEHARTKHPVFSASIAHGAHVVRAESDELIHAARHEGKERAHDECLDVQATAFRFMNQEWERD